VNLLKDQFIGAWTLQEWLIEYPDDTVRHPFGADASGQLLYCNDGQMSATIMASKRLASGHSSARELSESLKVQAFDSYFHYAGNWTIESDMVLHKVSFSLNSDFVGTTQYRKAKFLKKDQLSLIAEETLAHRGSRMHILRWLKSP
tara:strand:- start:88 stop:525 length:438 start_codon:yes stop_codon:yes gene_type:complete